MSMSELHAAVRALQEACGRFLAVVDGAEAERQPSGGYQPDERFDPQRREHRMAAEAIFRRLGIDDRGASWFWNTRFHGIRRGELEHVIESEHKAFCRKFPNAAKARERQAREWRDRA